MPESNGKYKLFERKMKAENLPDIVIENFKFYYDRLAGGETGLIPETEILPVEALADIQAQPADELARIGAGNLSKAVIIKLNGGLGTSMGMQKAKSLLKVKGDFSFLDIIVKQTRCFDQPVPVIFMNSFSTQVDTLNAL
jgi:UTP--glucose-1-phosphate uridylyltransferase